MKIIVLTLLFSSLAHAEVGYKTAEDLSIRMSIGQEQGQYLLNLMDRIVKRSLDATIIAEGDLDGDGDYEPLASIDCCPKQSQGTDFGLSKQSQGVDFGQRSLSPDLSVNEASSSEEVRVSQDDKEISLVKVKSSYSVEGKISNDEGKRGRSTDFYLSVHKINPELRQVVETLSRPSFKQIRFRVEQKGNVLYEQVLPVKETHKIFTPRKRPEVLKSF